MCISSQFLHPKPPSNARALPFSENPQDANICAVRRCRHLKLVFFLFNFDPSCTKPQMKPLTSEQHLRV